jgi:hypothetical protein
LLHFVKLVTRYHIQESHIFIDNLPRSHKMVFYQNILTQIKNIL